jgi:hypothetical protein
MRPDTHICYGLEEAAGQLQLSESILLRLSQFFRVPSDAYEDVGSMSFKADPVFYEAEMAFFLEVKKRLLAGETLQQLKKNPPRLKKSFPQPEMLNSNPNTGSSQAKKPGLASPSLRSGTPLSNTLNSLNRRQRDSSQLQGLSPVEDRSQGNSVASSELREIPSDEHMLSRVADDRFKQYKKKNGGFGLKKVFQKLLKDLGMTEAQGVEDFEMFHPQQSIQQHPYRQDNSEEEEAAAVERSSQPSGRKVEQVYEPPKPRDLRPADHSTQDWETKDDHTSPLEFISTNNAANGQETHPSARPYQLSEQVLHAARNLRHQAAERYSDDSPHGSR